MSVCTGLIQLISPTNIGCVYVRSGWLEHLVDLKYWVGLIINGKKKVKVWFYIALYPVRWTAQSALHFPPLADLASWIDIQWFTTDLSLDVEVP